MSDQQLDDNVKNCYNPVLVVVAKVIFGICGYSYVAEFNIHRIVDLTQKILTCTGTIMLFSTWFHETADKNDPWGWPKSIYFTVYTMTTIGYGDFAPANGSQRWAAVVLIYTSATWLLLMMTYIFQAVLNEVSSQHNYNILKTLSSITSNKYHW